MNIKNINEKYYDVVHRRKLNKNEKKILAIRLFLVKCEISLK